MTGWCVLCPDVYMACLVVWVVGQAYALLGAIVMSLYIVFDTFLIIRRYSYDDYTMAAISLYLE